MRDRQASCKNRRHEARQSRTLRVNGGFALYLRPCLNVYKNLQIHTTVKLSPMIYYALWACYIFSVGFLFGWGSYFQHLFHHCL
jgi:hypothetical protein